MKRIRERPPAEAAGKKLLGAMAGGVVDSAAGGICAQAVVGGAYAPPLHPWGLTPTLYVA